MKVLAFEDSVDIEALLISGGIDLSAIEFKQFWDSQNYLERISKFSPDILMLDHYMPPTRGLDLTSTQSVWNKINERIKDDICLFFSTPDID